MGFANALNLPVGPTRRFFVTNLKREETQNAQCFQQGLKMKVVLQTFLFADNRRLNGK
jgi:hypothetical protein